MNIDHAEGDDILVSEDVERSTLAELLADPRFRVTERGKSIIRYIAACYFSGNIEGIKGYSIAVDVLGRSCSFDPSIDPIVRIEMSRLRTSLFQYYEAYGNELDVWVEIPKGKYTLSFTHRYTSLKQVEDTAHDVRQLLPTQPLGIEKSGSKFSLTLALLLAAALATLLVIVNYVRAPSVTTKPVVSVQIQASDNALRGEASQLRDALLTALTQFSAFAIQSSGVDSGGARLVDYEIELKFHQNDGAKSVWWAIKDVELSETLQSGNEEFNGQDQSALNVRDALIPILAAQFAAAGSVINLSELRKSDANDLGNVCILRADLITEGVIAQGIQDVQNCLQRTLRMNPNDSEAIASLAKLGVVPINGSRSKEAIENGRELARSAVAHAPMSDRAWTALMLTQFHAGKLEAAIDTGQKTVAVNPNNPTTLGSLAWILFSSGQWDKAVELEKAGGRVPSVTPSIIQLFRAFDAYRKQDWVLTAARVKYFHEFAAENRAEGDAVYLTLSMPLSFKKTNSVSE